MQFGGGFPSIIAPLGPLNLRQQWLYGNQKCIQTCWQTLHCHVSCSPRAALHCYAYFTAILLGLNNGASSYGLQVNDTVTP